MFVRRQDEFQNAGAAQSSLQSFNTDVDFRCRQGSFTEVPVKIFVLTFTAFRVVILSATLKVHEIAANLKLAYNASILVPNFTQGGAPKSISLQ